jgi:hypothetical protein
LVDHLPSMFAYGERDMRWRYAREADKTWFGVDRARMIGMLC